MNSGGVDAILVRLLELHPKIIDLSLERVYALLARLGNPHHHLPPVVHIAGTNGKGSTLAFIRTVLEAQGYRVHAYTSPHLVRFAERVCVAGTFIEDDALLALLEECERVNDGVPITFFEITTVAALLAFARTRADIVLLETGLGGRLDATNVVATPALSIITPISRDHEQYLGEGIEAIACEKAGIIKPGVACVVAAQTDTAGRVIQERAAACAAPVMLEERDWNVRTQGDDFVFHALRADALMLPRPALVGEHQVHNAGLALAALHCLDDFPCTPDAMRKAMHTVSWPARLQALNGDDLGDGIPPWPAAWRLWLDGGHNEAAGAVLAAQMRQWRTDDPDVAIYVIIAMLDNKDASAYLRHLHAGGMTALYATGMTDDDHAAFSPDALKSHAMQAGCENVHSAPSVMCALKKLLQMPDETKAGTKSTMAHVLITGSLYLAGEVLRHVDA